MMERKLSCLTLNVFHHWKRNYTILPLERLEGTVWNRLAWCEVELFLHHLLKKNRFSEQVFEKSPNQTDRSDCVCTFEKSLCEDVHRPGAVHTHHLLQSVTPARVWRPAGESQSSSSSLHGNSLFAALRLYTHQTTVPKPEPKSRRDWGAKEGSLFFICDNQKKSKTDI